MAEFNNSHPQGSYLGPKPIDHRVLDGTPVYKADDIRILYAQGHFNYQFLKPHGRRSRVMTCSSEDERDWLIKQLDMCEGLIVKPIPKPEGSA